MTPVIAGKRVCADPRRGIGDEMTFRVAGVDLTGRVSNLREVAWDSFEV
ncbi:MAG: hypothetical protein CM1200mP18_17650 [Gammaproteobacteria bacterium]|nr:MAG: hypothetical protein CM1200mP18_17650 [Gammaproteobacteria bacterium]